MKVIGPYQILAELGRGGMGEVYRARDPRLNRDVAIKVLHASVASDPERLRRFTAEAQAVAALNHPNILTIYEVGTHDGHPFLATELLEGDTLRARLEAGAIPPSKAIDFARQTASGLSAAHAKGIAHRDIKPENLFITTDGRLKILDFGLAKALDQSGAGSDDTRLQSGTSAGVVLGTVGYMSPEQVRAQPIDHRTDIFSLGIVLYEMLTGQRPFVGGSAVETMNAILTLDPPEMTSSTARVLPVGLAHVVRHCLEKNPEERFQSARDLSFALQSLSASTSSGATSAIAGDTPAPVPAQPRGSRLRRLGLAAAILGAGVIGAGLGINWRGSAPALDLTKYRFTPFAADPEPESRPAWSPDGRSLAFVKDARIYVRSLDSDDASPVTSGRLVFDRLFWFPDSARVGFVTSQGVFAVSRAGGDPERIQEGPVQAAALSADGQTLALWKISFDGPRRTASLWFASPITAAPKKYELGLVDQVTLSPNHLEFSPDGRTLVYTGFRPSASMWLISMEGSAATGPPRQVFDLSGWSSPPQVSWMPDNRSVVLAQDEDLWVGDVRAGTLAKITAGVQNFRDPAVSPDGRRIAFTAGQTDYDLVEIPIADGPVTDFLASARREIGAMWLPPASRGDFLYLTDKSGGWEIRTRKPDGSERVVVGARSFPEGGAGDITTAAPSADGSRVLFSRWDGKRGAGDTWIVPVTGGVPVSAAPDGTDQWTAIWSPDGRQVMYETPVRGAVQVRVQRVGSSDPPVTILETTDAVGAFHPEWSPTGEWIAYQTDGYISLFSPDGKTRRNLIRDRAYSVAWSRDGRTLYAIALGDPKMPNRHLVSIDVASGKERTRRPLPASIRPATPLSPAIRMSLNADETKFLTSVVRVRADVWILER